jgi:glycosyltransferase involved in cell wall biosynthesis
MPRFCAADLAGSCPRLVVFADDWGRHPSSCQHLMGQLIGRYDITWVNTIGMRPPRFNASTWRRGWEKIRHWSPTTGRCEPAPVRVLNPKMWPWFGSTLSRALNRELLVRQLTPVVRGGPAPIGVTTLPIVADVVGRLPLERWVYYCVDDFSQWPGLDQSTMQRMEERLVQQADTLIAVSEVLQAKLGRMGRSAHLLTHGVDLDFWRPGTRTGPFPYLSDREQPWIVFWGVIDRRMDVDFVRYLANVLAKGTIVLAGPEAEADPALWQMARVVHLPPVPFEQLPHLAQEAAVLIMPYGDYPVNRSIQPLKLKEYLATGKAVVVRDLPATRAWADCLDLAATPAAFAEAVQKRLRSGLPQLQGQARARLDQETWAAKARTFEHWLGGGSEAFDA